MASASTSQKRNTTTSSEGLITRSWHAVLSPFSSSALEALPDTSQRNRDRETRADRIPEGEGDVVVRDYSAINNNQNGSGGGNVNDDGPDGGRVEPASAIPVSVRVPKKIPTPIRVEGKVWFANERTWLSYLNIGVLIGTLALALFNASEDAVARNFAYIYALISIGVLVYGWVVYQKRITMIRKRDPGPFDQIGGPVIISALLFFAVLANFVIRGPYPLPISFHLLIRTHTPVALRLESVQEVRRKGVPIPGE